MGYHTDTPREQIQLVVEGGDVGIEVGTYRRVGERRERDVLDIIARIILRD